jgi:Tfp pilus assembly protein PilV
MKTFWSVKRFSSKAGLSLMEVLVAIDILALAFFFIVGVVPFDNASVKQDAHILVATQLGQELLNNIANMFYDDGTSENGVPLSSTWDGFSQTATVNGNSIPSALYCLSSSNNCPTTGVAVDPLDQTRPPDTFFPPYPYAPASCVSCSNPGSYGSVLISTTSDGIPDSRQYYFYVETEPLDATGAFTSWNASNIEPDLRFVKVIVFWHENTRSLATTGPNSWQQAGYRSILLTTTMASKGGP